MCFINKRIRSSKTNLTGTMPGSVRGKPQTAATDQTAYVPLPSYIVTYTPKQLDSSS